MEIEKLNDNQIKFILNKSDLQQRDLKIGELAYGSEKTQELFREMMTEALLKYDFQTENTPLMIEAIPLSRDSIIIIVTKVSNSEDIEDKFQFFANQQERAKLKRKSKSDTESTKSSELVDNILIYSFDSLGILSEASDRLFGRYAGESSVYKYDHRFYLVLEKQNKIKVTTGNLESLLSEYGLKHISTNVSKYFLVEHGEALIKKDAVEIASKYL